MAKSVVRTEAAPAPFQGAPYSQAIVAGEFVFVSGQVYRPGEYTIRAGMTVRQVLALAGGVTDRGSTRRIQIIRHTDGKETTIGADQQDIVRGGDTILVRERFF